MITLHDILCILGWHDWKLKHDKRERRCYRCPKEQELVGNEVYQKWVDKA